MKFFQIPTSLLTTATLSFFAMMTAGIVVDAFVTSPRPLPPRTFLEPSTIAVGGPARSRQTLQLYVLDPQKSSSSSSSSPSELRASRLDGASTTTTTTTVTTNDDDEKSSVVVDFIPESSSSSEYTLGLAIISVVALIFASHSPVTHGAFSLVEHPAPPLVINAFAAIMAFLGLVTSRPFLENSNILEPPPTTGACTTEKEQEQDVTTSTTTSTDGFIPIRAGFELGLCKTLGATFQFYGLSLTTASHGAFLVQLTTLFVPVIQGITGKEIITPKIWTAVSLALAGVFLFTQGSGTAGGGTDATLLGDGLCLCAALFLGLYDLRLSKWGDGSIPSVTLITNKIASQALLSTGLMFAFGYNEAISYLQNTGQVISSWISSLSTQLNTFSIAPPVVVPQTTTTSYSSILTDGIALITGTSTATTAVATTDFTNTDVLTFLFVISWAGLLVNAGASLIQVRGQAAIGATRSQILYATQPLMAAILSYICLNETVSPIGFVGGAMFLFALGLTIEPEQEQKAEQQSETI